MLNQQPTSPTRRERDLQLHHIFPTIQGEGPFAGTPAIFVRLYGCNLRCPGCDTDYTSRCEQVTPAEIVTRIIALLDATRHRSKYNTALPLVVITGGEPFRQSLGELVTLIHLNGMRSQIETNGTLWDNSFPTTLSTIVCSPKTGRIHPQLAENATAFKYVVQAGFIDQTDGLPFATLGQPDQTSVARPPVGSKAEIFVQPLDEQDETKNRANLEAAIKSCQKFGYRLCIQTHKLANLE